MSISGQATRTSSPTSTSIHWITPALTTPFVAPQSCLSSSVLFPYSDNGSYYIAGPSPGASECFPPGYHDNVAFYSPGVCPQGWQPILQDIAVRPPGYITDTFSTCCPSAYNISTGIDDYSCISDKGIITDTAGSTSPMTIYQTAVIVVQHATDSMSTTSTGMSKDVPTSQNTTNSKSGLSLGATVGIGVGASLGTLCAAAIVFGIFFLRRRKRRSIQNAPTAPKEIPPSHSSQNNSISEMPDSTKVSEMPTSISLSEMPNYNTVSEMPTSTSLSEMPTPTFFIPELPTDEKDKSKPGASSALP